MDWQNEKRVMVIDESLPLDTIANTAAIIGGSCLPVSVLRIPYCPLTFPTDRSDSFPPERSAVLRSPRFEGGLPASSATVMEGGI